MASLTPGQLRTRRRVESVIRLMAPALDLVLAAGDRISRIVERDDVEYSPPRVTRGADSPRTTPRSGPGQPGPSRTAPVPAHVGG